MKAFGWLIVISVGAAGCIPAHLKKYTRKGNRSPDTEVSESRTSLKKESKDTDDSGKSRPTVYSIDQKTFRFLLEREDVWSSALDVLMKNYNLIIVDKESGIITTEWDSFYLDGKVYRNKVSVHVKWSGRRRTDVSVMNNVETLEPGSVGGIASVWLPTDKGDQEIGRIVQNMALFLNQPPPQLPGTMVAKSSL